MRLPRVLLSIALALTLVLGGGLVPACGDGSSPGTAGDAGGCRFSQGSCVTCIQSSCGTDADACYGAGFAPGDLCNPSGTAAASCTQATSAQEGLDLQFAYSRCVLGACLGDCE